MVVRNQKKVTCVYADKIAYIITAPVRIGQVGAFGTKNLRYRATLVGVQIRGQTVRFYPPVIVYFARALDDTFPEETEERGT